jgi:hypothetical protein
MMALGFWDMVEGRDGWKEGREGRNIKERRDFPRAVVGGWWER